MTPDIVKTALVQALIEVQVCSGRTISDIDDTTCPIGDLDGFDSLNAVEVATLVSSQLGQVVDAKLLVPDRAHPHLPVGNMVVRICRTIGSAGGTIDEQG